MNISEKTKLTFTLNNILTLVTTVFAISGVWFHLQSQIDEAKELPKQKNDKIVREAVLHMNSDMQYIKTEIAEINNRLDKMEDRLYELK
jgi:Tfp pilus assembly protein PilO